MLGVNSHAQNITSSFDSMALGENPAAAATREFGIISPSYLTKYTQDKFDDSGTIIERKINSDRYEFVLAGRGRVVPELLVINQKSTVNVYGQTNKFDQWSGVGNLAFRFGEHVSLGVGGFNSDIDFKATSTWLTENAKLKTSGLSGGASVHLGDILSLGGFYMKINEGIESTGTYTDPISGATPINRSISYTHEKWGLGLSLQSGTAKKGGFRFEYSFIKMNFAKTVGWFYDDPDITVEPSKRDFMNTQQRAALEATTQGFTGGVSWTRVLGRYINYRYFMDAVLAEFPYYQDYSDTLGGFLGFKSSSGSTFGLSGSYKQGRVTAKLGSRDMNSDQTEYSYGASYAFLF